ncbi:hypothetical protein H6P81_019769 [Aristolochia fimbriata]|uniref:ribose-5-phosphate isomerase n=1 Tax=Aristolochia fimbriata TaxID=158543 RepID=A0AAV7DTJ4_ARIFI|nr:hypothetical protein H6P81_019769 [Aristolochia fimbriata]
MGTVLLHFSTTGRSIPSFPLKSYSGRGRKHPFAKTAVSCVLESSHLFEAARQTVDTHIKSGMVVGLGSGRASCLVIQYLGRQLREGILTDILGIPMSVSSASEAAKAGIPLDQYPNSLQIDFAFDDADVLEEGALTAVIGRRKLEAGESIIQEKSIVKSASKLAFIVSARQYTKNPDGSIPVLVDTVNWMETAEEIDDLFLGDAEVWRRPAWGYAGPTGGDFPLVTKEGHNVLDLIFTSPIQSLIQVAESLDEIDGVVDHGVVSGVPCTAVIASEEGVQIVDNVYQM